MPASCRSRTRWPARLATRLTLSPTASCTSSGSCCCPSATSCWSLPGVKVEEIEWVASHWQALSQCERFLAGRGWEIVPAADTAGAARELAARGDRHAAAVASERAAVRYGLEIAARDIQDSSHNVTRFAVLARDPATDLTPRGDLAPSGRWRARDADHLRDRPQAGRPVSGARLARRCRRQRQPHRVTALGERPVELPLPAPGVRRRLDRAAGGALVALREHTSSMRVLGSFDTAGGQ